MERRDFLHAFAWSAASLTLVRSMSACRTVPATIQPSAADDRFVQLRDRYVIRHLQLNPVTSTYLGGEGLDPAALGDANERLRDWSPTALETERVEYRDMLAALRTIPAESLTPAVRVDYSVMEAQLMFLLHMHEDLRHYERAVDTYVAEPFRGVDWQILGMSDAGGGLLGTEGEWRQVVARLERIPRYLEIARANLQTGHMIRNVPDRRLIQRDGIQGSTANAEYFRATLPATSARLIGDRPFAREVQTDIAGAGREAAEAYGEFILFLQRTFDANDAIDRFPAGEREYAWRVRNVLRDTRTPAELMEYGRAQVAQYQEKMTTVAREIATAAQLGLRWESETDRRVGIRAVIEHLGAEAPRDDDEMLAWYREAADRAVVYGRERGLFDVPADYQMAVTPTPPVLRSTIDAAYYPAPPFKAGGTGQFFVTPTGNDPAALKINNRPSVTTTAVHEGFPGHDWHYRFMTQFRREISPIRWLTPGAVEDSSSMWEDSMATEGWALYAEELLAESAPGRPYGFYTPAEYLYVMQAQLMRAVRVVVDVGIHTGRMRFDEAVDYFAENVEFIPQACMHGERDATARAVCESARRAIYRYSKWPTQAITYNLGKNAIRELREEVQRRQGDAFDLKAFHERLLKMGTIPVGHYRALFVAG